MLENIPHLFATTKQFYRFSSWLFVTARHKRFLVLTVPATSRSRKHHFLNNVYIKTSTVILSHFKCE